MVSSPSSVSGTGPAGSLQTAKRLADEILARAGEEETIDAEQILREHPELDQFHSVAVDLVYEQFLRQVEAGEAVDPADLAARFPRHQESLLRLFHVHEHLDLQNLDGRPEWPSAPGPFLDFQLVEEIGRGSFSRVFSAIEPAVGNRKVVVKVTTHAVAELSTLGKLNHPNVVPVFSARRDPDSELTAICMPYVSRSTLFDAIQHCFGESLMPTSGRVFREATRLFNGLDMSTPHADMAEEHEPAFGRSYVDAVLHIGLQLAEALAYTHEQGILHCDIKPSNVLLTTSGNAMVFDFNLAFLEQTESDGTVRGTLAYMAPEQLRAALGEADRSAHHIDGRTDIYSFGVTLYELLCGKLPYDARPKDRTGRSYAREQFAIQQTGPPPLGKLNRQVDTRLAKLIERSLAFDPELRPQSAQEVVEAMRQQLSASRRLTRWARERRKLLLGIGAASVVAAGIPVLILIATETQAERFLREGWEFFKAQDYPRALTQFQRSVDHDPSNNDALFARGRAYVLLGEYELARQDFSVVELHFPSDGRVKACLAHCLSHLAFPTIDRGGFRDAAVKYQQAVALGFANAAVYNNLGYCFLKTASPMMAGDFLDIALQFDSQSRTAYHNLAKLELIRESPDLPNLEFIEQALEIGPPSPELYLDAAKIYALAARRAGDAVRNDAGLKEQFENQSLKNCKLALEQGLRVEGLLHVAKVQPKINERVEFQHLLRSSFPNNKAPLETACVLDPLIGLDEPIELGDG